MRHAFLFPRSNLSLLIISGIIFSAVNVTFYMAISLTSVAAAITLEYTAPLFILIFTVTN
jgi:threonine/homoserine efflux transporter RhtA